MIYIVKKQEYIGQWTFTFASASLDWENLVVDFFFNLDKVSDSTNSTKNLK